MKIKAVNWSQVIFCIFIIKEYYLLLICKTSYFFPGHYSIIWAIKTNDAYS